MGAYKFVGEGGDPDNTLKQLNKKPGIFGGIVIIATWSQLQPRPNATIGDDNVIEQVLDKVRAYNRRNPQKPLAVKLRIWGGFEAPQWAKKIGGAPISTVHKGKQRIIGRFWLPEYRKAWAALQQQLAKRFDDERLIREVAITSCMSFTAEPFFIPTTEATVMTPLLAAGFQTEALQEMPHPRGSGLRTVEADAAGVVGQSAAYRFNARARRCRIHQRSDARLPAGGRAALRVRQPRSRQRPDAVSRPAL